MEKNEKTLVRPKLTTLDDYIKQRERSLNDFEKFVEQRNASKVTYFEKTEEKKRMQLASALWLSIRVFIKQKQVNKNRANFLALFYFFYFRL